MKNTRYTIRGITKALSVLLVLTIIEAREAWSQCPAPGFAGVRWEGEKPDEDTQDAMITQVRRLFADYCRTADFRDQLSGNVSSEKCIAFNALFLGRANSVFNDIRPEEGNNMSPEDYSALVRKDLYTSGLEFRLEEPQLTVIRALDDGYEAEVTFRKVMYNGLDMKGRYKSYGRDKSKMAFSMKMTVTLMPEGDGTWRATIYALSNVNLRSSTKVRYSDLHASLLTSVSHGAVAAFPWPDLSGVDLRHFAQQLEYRQFFNFPGSETWFWSVGAGVRRGVLNATIGDEPKVYSWTANTAIERQGTLYADPFERTLTLASGSEVKHSYFSAFVPLGFRYRMYRNSSNRHEFLLDGGLMAGYSLFDQVIDPSKINMVRRLPGFDPTCTSAFTTGSATETSWTEYMLNARFSPAYFMPLRTSKLARASGFFIGLDLEMALLPLFSRPSGSKAWAESDFETSSVAIGELSRDAGVNLLVGEYKPIQVGLRAGFTWKIVR